MLRGTGQGLGWVGLQQSCMCKQEQSTTSLHQRTPPAAAQLLHPASDTPLCVLLQSRAVPAEYAVSAVPAVSADCPVPPLC